MLPYKSKMAAKLCGLNKIKKSSTSLNKRLKITPTYATIVYILRNSRFKSFFAAKKGICKVKSAKHKHCYPAVRMGSSNTRFFFFGDHLPQTSVRSKQYFPVMCVLLAFIRQNFHERWCRKLLAI